MTSENFASEVLKDMNQLVSLGASLLIVLKGERKSEDRIGRQEKIRRRLLSEKCHRRDNKNACILNARNYETTNARKNFC